MESTERDKHVAADRIPPTFRISNNPLPIDVQEKAEGPAKPVHGRPSNIHVPVTSPVCSESRMAAVMLLLAKSRSSWSSLRMSNLPVSSSHPTEPSLLSLLSSRRNRSQLRLDRAGATN